LAALLFIKTSGTDPFECSAESLSRMFLWVTVPDPVAGSPFGLLRAGGFDHHRAMDTSPA